MAWFCRIAYLAEGFARLSGRSGRITLEGVRMSRKKHVLLERQGGARIGISMAPAGTGVRGCDSLVSRQRSAAIGGHWCLFRSRYDSCMSNGAADSDALILVDEADRSLGFLSKALCHEGRGVLHRAFSLLIFNERGELLIQQRAASKRLWPMYWSNSCCSHPRGDESMETATQRRLLEELGIRCPLQFLFKFQYQAQFDATGAENELCSVYIGRCRETD